MAVLIENIDKPQHCYSCPYSETVGMYHKICSIVPDSGSIEVWDSPPLYCPMKEAVKIKDTSEILIEEKGVFKAEGAIWRTEKKTVIYETENKTKIKEY